MKLEGFETKRVIKVTVSLIKVPWNPEEIAMLLKEISESKDFLGFQKIYFEANECPEIVYLRKLDD